MGFRDHIGKDQSQPLGNNFCDDFVDHVADGYGPELGHSRGVITFGNKSKESIVHLRNSARLTETIQNKIVYGLANSVPLGFKEERVKPVRSWSFEILHTKQNLLRLFDGNSSTDSSKILLQKARERRLSLKGRLNIWRMSKDY